MGNILTNKPNRLNKTDREIVKKNRLSFISLRKNEITNIETQIQNEAIQQIKNSSNNQVGLQVLTDVNTTTAILQTTKKQLDRKGLPLTKTDLIAIIIALDPIKYSGNINALNDNTVVDLNTAIRLIIYDPSRYVNIQNNETSKIMNVEQNRLL
jgi:hypothetical protein